MRTVLLGTGNVAHILGKKIRDAGHAIVQVWGRTEEKASDLSARLHAPFITSLDQLTPDADLYILSVSDDAIPAVAAQLQIRDGLLVHTAGAVNKEVLKCVGCRYGVLYPLQSLRKETAVTIDFPILVDAADPADLAALLDFGYTLSQLVQAADDEQRRHLHLAAVLVSNFTNHLYALTEAYCRQEKVDFQLLLPLIEQVGNRLRFGSAADLQTGPAIRGDATTIQKHLELLQHYPQLYNMYDWFTRSIQQQLP